MNMTLPNQLRRQFEHNFWANQELLRALSSMPDPPPGALKLMKHIVAAQWIWLDRLLGTEQRTAGWPEMSTAEIGAQLQKIEQGWRPFMATLSDDRLASTIAYTNSRGEPWESSVLDVIIQVLLHSVHHRGQVSLEIRRAGTVPPPLDYSHAVRQHLIA